MIDPDTTVYVAPNAHVGGPQRYHRTLDCCHLDHSLERSTTTAAAARAENLLACARCIGRYCPRCDDLHQGHLADHLKHAHGVGRSLDK